MKIFISLVFLFLSGCVTVHNISNSSFAVPVTESNTGLVQAVESGSGFLHLTEPGLHVIGKLRSACPQGIVHGIETKLVSRDFFLLQSFELTAIGYCTKK